MSSSLPDGYRARSFGATDVDAVTSLLVEEEGAVRGTAYWSRADTEGWLHTLGDLGEGTLLDDANGDLVGMLGIVRRDDVFNGWIVVRPSHFGRGVEEALLSRAESWTRTHGGTRLHVDTFADNAVLREILSRSGYEEERRHFLMRVDFDARPPEPSLPTGVTISTFDPERDARDFHRAINEAFEGQWGFRALPFEDWVRLRIEAPDFDPAIWLVARDGDDIAGVLRGDPERWSCGWIGMVAVRPQWQRRGIGSALIRRAFRVFYDRGKRCVGLGVDTQNPTGATRLYERLGMRATAEDVTYAKVLG